MSCTRATELESCYIDCRLANKKFDDMSHTPQIKTLGFCDLMGRNIDTSVHNKQPDPKKSPLESTDCFTVKDAITKEPAKAIFVCSKLTSCNSVSFATTVNSNHNSNEQVEQVKTKVIKYAPQYVRSKSSGFDEVSDVADKADAEIHSQWIKQTLTDEQRVALLLKAYAFKVPEANMQYFFKQTIGGLTPVDQLALYGYTSSTKHCTAYRWSLRQECDDPCRAHWYLFDEAIHEAFAHHHVFYEKTMKIKKAKIRNHVLRENKMSRKVSIPHHVWHGMGGVIMDIFEAMLPKSWIYDDPDHKLFGFFKYYGPVSTTTSVGVAERFASHYEFPRIVFLFRPIYDISNPNYPPLNLGESWWLVEETAEKEVLFFDQTFEILHTQITPEDNGMRAETITKQMVVDCRKLFAVQEKIVVAKDQGQIDELKTCYKQRFVGENGWAQMDPKSYEMLASLGSKARSEEYGSYVDAAPMHSQRKGHMMNGDVKTKQQTYRDYSSSFHSHELPQTQIVMFLLLLMVGLCLIGFMFCAICA
eukprot:120380_1